MTENITNYRKVAELAAQAGGKALEGLKNHFSVSEKGRFDLVTDADHAAQAAIHHVIKEHFPQHDFLGEESAGAATFRGSIQPTWVVDPIDGTTNFVHQFPLYCVSVGLWMKGEVVAGAIFDPNRGELFSAAKGQGASLDGKPIRCSTTNNLEQSLLAVGFPANLVGKEDVIEAWKQFGYVTQGLRRTGSAAINLAYIAAGRFDGFFAYQIAPWDMAAGVVLLQEAGGVISDIHGKPYELFSHAPIVASNGVLQEHIVAVLERVSSV